MNRQVVNPFNYTASAKVVPTNDMKMLSEERRAASPRRFEPETVSEFPGPEIEIKSILVPLDFSRASMEALNYAVPLAKKLAAEVHLVHVKQDDEASEVVGAGHLMRETANSIEFLREELLEHGKQVAGFWPEGCHVRSGQPYQEICTLAHEIDADLIVLGTRGHTGLKRILLGSTAERVVRFSARPVLVVRRRRSNKRKRFAIRKILAPVDFSRCSMAGAMYAALLAKTFDAKLSILHVFAGEIRPATDKAHQKSLKNNDAIDLENARLDMEAFTQLDFLHDVKRETEICAGNAVDEICRRAGESDVDLVVIATHGRTGFDRMLLGSVAEHVVRCAECPVMVVPSRFSDLDQKIVCRILLSILSANRQNPRSEVCRI
jgi:nucleotide-binding universal stress UspA family protein